MLRLLIACVALLVVLYGVKVVLLQVAVPLESALDQDSIRHATQGGHNVEDTDDSLTRVDDGKGLSGGTGAAAVTWEIEGGNITELKAGVRAWRRGLDSDALAHFESCITSGVKEGGAQISVAAACRTQLAEMYLVGAGVSRNVSEARILLQQAADLGDPDAQFNVGALHGALPSDGEDPQHREALAILNHYAASTAGHPGALMAMGYRHMYGYGVPKSCPAAALNYIDVAKRVANVYSAGMPQAVELIRLNLHQKDRKAVSSSEMNLFAQIATSGDTTVAAAIGKRYLLGIEGFRQDYRKARHYLRMAANRNHAGALALLGYMYCLGLGTTKNLDTAYSYFVSASAQNDPLGHNGIGYIYFRGTSVQAKNMKLAFKHFNESAFGGSSDGMFNLASMFLTGTGTDQSFQKAVLFYTQALDRGHTPAAYSLAVMHLNGIGVMRDCDIAVNLLKKVCERGEWVSSKLVDAYEYGEQQPDHAALLFLKLAEAGHEVAQMNAAHLFDMGSTGLLQENLEGGWNSQHEFEGGGGVGTGGSLATEARQHGKVIAQRFYELSAEQGSASSELRLGDYFYYGWGIDADFAEDANATEADGTGASLAQANDEDESWQDVAASIFGETELEMRQQEVDYEGAIGRYRRAAEMTVTGEWMQAFVARGFFNLGFMHQFGMGVVQDLHLAKQHYHRCREVDPSGLHTPVTMVLVLLGVHMAFLRLPPWKLVAERLLADMRVHIVVLHVIAMVVLFISRRTLMSVRRRPQAARPKAQAAPTPPAPRPAPQELFQQAAGVAVAAPAAAAAPAPAAASAAAPDDESFVLH